MCILSVFSHIFTLVMIIYSYFYFNITVFWLYFIADFFLPLRGTLDFILFVFFNKKFRNSVARKLF
jgi:hypothetical protein